MSNPTSIFCDTDALIQFFLGNQLRILERFRAEFLVLPTIVAEVELEIRNNRRFGNQFEYPFRRAVESGTLAVLDEDSYQIRLAGFPVGLVETLWQKIQKLGEQFESHIDTGEAYTQAAGQVLSAPILSNDYAAIKALLNSNYNSAVPALRSFDFFCFAYKHGWIEKKSFKQLLQRLSSNKEWLPRDFRDKGWSRLDEIVQQFDCRLEIWDRASRAPNPNRYSDCLFLKADS